LYNFFSLQASQMGLYTLQDLVALAQVRGRSLSDVDRSEGLSDVPTGTAMTEAELPSQTSSIAKQFLRRHCARRRLMGVYPALSR
jgi:hypothetical protein